MQKQTRLRERQRKLTREMNGIIQSIQNGMYNHFDKVLFSFQDNPMSESFNHSQWVCEVEYKCRR